ncbi:MAG: HAMP domain-containing protein [Chloroflexi bacterium]|jgi:two-component system, NarL family, sensor histidine kinase LiaS|nr:HAMP domain-containing protein [Chloroflexota bacterium]
MQNDECRITLIILHSSFIVHHSPMQTQLTRSHLAVTLISVVILAALIATGYLIYLQTDLPAQWAGDEAYYIAEDITWLLEDAPLTIEFAEEYIWDVGFVPVAESWNEDSLYYEDWLVILAPDGGVIASNDAWRYPPGESPALSQLPGWDSELEAIDTSQEDPENLVAYAVFGEDHIGQATIIALDGAHLGWVYYRIGGVGAPYTSGETLAALAVVILGSGLIAIIVSGFTGSRLARSFSLRFQRMNQASAALAAGNLSSRVAIEGDDEIAQVGEQFNHMADQIGTQMHDLRALAERNAMLAEEARSLAAVEERSRLARELHDALKQQIFGLSLSANAARQLLEKAPVQAAERLAQLEEQARDIHLEMDAIIKQLRPASLGDRGLASALRQLTAKWQNQHPVKVSLSLQGERELPLSVEQALFRISQEALNNIAKHAQASTVTIELVYETGQIRLNINDDGIGFDPASVDATLSLGLRSMQERAEEIGATLEINSQANQGCTIKVRVSSVAV